MIAFFAKLLGYMTAAQALQHGFTHHGCMYGIPCWVGDIESEGPMLCTKWAPAELLLSIGHFVQGFTNQDFFAIGIGEPIDAKGARDEQ